MSDPLMPVERWFPRNQDPVPVSIDLPSVDRPYALRLAGVGGVIRQGKHRTPATRTEAKPVPMTTSDGDQPRQTPDPYYVPDD